MKRNFFGTVMAILVIAAGCFADAKVTVIAPSIIFLEIEVVDGVPVGRLEHPDQFVAGLMVFHQSINGIDDLQDAFMLCVNLFVSDTVLFKPYKVFSHGDSLRVVPDRRRMQSPAKTGSVAPQNSFEACRNNYIPNVPEVEEG
ncbi:MAG: hypothetical protein JW863_19670 [Chitinispirillaceae bacterium]|nr:hypothetical protein [Chitinispirillaceae bacterium]